MTDERGKEEVQEQVYDDAFKEAEGKVAPVDKVDTIEEIKEEPAKIEEPEKKEEPVAKIEEPAKIEKSPEDLEAERELQRQRTLEGILKPHKEAWETEKKSLLTQIEELKKPKEEKKEDKEDKEDVLSPEDKEAFAKYEEDFDLVSKMEGKKREVELKKLEKRFKAFVQDTVKSAKEEFNAQIAPAAELVKTSKVKEEKQEEKDHFDMIRNGYILDDGTEVSGHPDYEKYVKDGSIKKWIDTKPKYIQKGLLEICDHGTAEDVVELLSDFKKENNINPQSPPEKVVNIDKEKKKQALRVVDTGKSAVQTKMHVATDYEGAFDEALQKGG